MGTSTAASVSIKMHVNAAASLCGQTHAHTMTNDEWANHVGSMLLIFRDSDAGASIVIISCQETLPLAQPVKKLLPRY